MDRPNTTPNEPETWAITDAAGNILDVSDGASAMLNISRLHLRRRSLLMFFAADRPEWTRLLRLASQGHHVQRTGSMRPRDRRARAVHVEVMEIANYPAMKAFEWRFQFVEVQQFKAAG